MKMVQRILICFALGISGFGKTLAAAPDDLLASSHFIGTTAAVNQSAKLKEIFALPESTKFRDDILQKLARTSLKFVGGDSKNANQTALLQPLFQDLIAAESVIELRGKTNLEFFAAVKLSDARSKVWETNLQQLVKGTKQTAKLDGITGWQAKANRNFLKFFRDGKWTVVALALEESPAQTDFLQRLRASTVPEKSFLAADIDWPKLQRWIPLDSIPLKLARTEIKIVAQGENLRSAIRVIYPEKIDWKSEPWQIPTELIRDPLISFSAGQKLAPFFKPSNKFQQLSFNPLTNQVYFWAQSQMPFQSYFALPVKNATNTIRALGPQLATAFNPTLKMRDGGTLTVASNKVDLFWQGLAIIVPFLNPAKEKNGSEFLLGGIFPLVKNTNLPPAELFGQISGQKDLVFYDWEVTEPRLSQWIIVGQLLPLFPKELVAGANAAAPKRFVPAKVPEQKWLAAVAPKLGNTITQVTYKSPNELNVVRKSHLGLNSFELVLFSHWLADPKFPALKNSAPLPMADPSIEAPQRGRRPRP